MAISSKPRSHASAASNANDLANGLHEVVRSVIRNVQPIIEAEGISMPQFWSMKVVSSLQTASVNAVAKYLSISPPTVCVTIDQLEEAGLVSRNRSMRDRRMVEIALTPKGTALESMIWGKIGEQVARAVADMPTEDVATAARVVAELNRRLATPQLAPRVTA
jgi:DNA-binding MarR family transcriptional regulator